MTTMRTSGLWVYASIARPDHWFKNVFMLFGCLLAFSLEPVRVQGTWLGPFILAVVSVCLVASSNYVLNELLDARTDRFHPTKKDRPVPSGLVSIPLAYGEWVLLAVGGLGIAYLVNFPFFLSAAVFWFAGVLYNAPPLRTKDVLFVDVLTESMNNPIRLFLGWFVLIPDQVPPLSVVISYWMAGAFFMAAKRFAEFNTIQDPERAGRYRASFLSYDAETLSASQFFYATACTFFFGIFVVRYHLALILAAPLIAGFFAYYAKLSHRPNSPVQSPEKLYRERGLMVYAVALLVLLVALLFIEIPVLNELFNVVPHNLDPLWTF